MARLLSSPLLLLAAGPGGAARLAAAVADATRALGAAGAVGAAALAAASAAARWLRPCPRSGGPAGCGEAAAWTRRRSLLCGLWGERAGVVVARERESAPRRVVVAVAASKERISSARACCDHQNSQVRSRATSHVASPRAAAALSGPADARRQSATEDLSRGVVVVVVVVLLAWPCRALESQARAAEPQVLERLCMVESSVALKQGLFSHGGTIASGGRCVLRPSPIFVEVGVSPASVVKRARARADRVCLAWSATRGATRSREREALREGGWARGRGQKRSAAASRR
jgi:hypothetical protein